MGGPIGRVREGDLLEIVIDRLTLEGRIDLVGHGGERFGPDEGARVLAARPPRPDLAPDPDLPEDTRLWAALQQVGGGTWGGCVYDVDAIVAALGGPRRQPGADRDVTAGRDVTKVQYPAGASRSTVRTGAISQEVLR